MYPQMPFYKNEKTKNQSIEYVNQKDGDNFIFTLHDKASFRKNSKFKEGGAPAIDAFYFRISGTNIYYTETDKDAVVLGAIAIKNIGKVQPGKTIKDKCFLVGNVEGDKWELCVMDEEENCETWVCAIQTVLGEECAKKEGEEGAEGEEEKKKEEEDKEKEKSCKKIIIEQPVYLLTLPAPICSIDFNYKAHGEDWLCGCEQKRF